MREFFSSVRFKVLAVVALILIGLMLRTAVSGGFATLPQQITALVVTPLQKASASISSGFTDMLSGFTAYSATKKENEQLKKQNSDLNTKLADYNEIKNENNQYKQMLGIKSEHNDFQLEPAMVISRDPGNWFSSFTIDKGSLNGLKPDDPVVTPEGLVGKVTQVMLTSSVVTTILDPSVSAGVLISQSNDVGISQGDNTLAEKGLFTVDYISKDSKVAQGDLIVTSGNGGVFPKMLKIGTIQQIKVEPNGLSLTAVVKPLADPTKVKDVFVITDFEGKQSTTASSSSTSSSASSSASSSKTSSAGKTASSSSGGK